MVTLPVPSVVMVTPVVPVALALSAMLPLEPDEVCRSSEFPEITFEVVIVPLAVRLNSPLVDVMAPVVPILALLPVVVTANSPPTDDAARVSAPALLKYALAGLELFTESVVVDVLMLVPNEPMSPVLDVKLSVLPPMVTSPERVTVAELLTLIPAAAPVRLMVAAIPPALANTRFCPALGEMVMAPPAVAIVDEAPESACTVKDCPLGDVIWIVLVPPETLRLVPEA